MPDQMLRDMMMFGESAQPAFVTQRILGYTQRLVNQLETIFGTATPIGSESAAELVRSAREVLRVEADQDARRIIDGIEGSASTAACPAANRRSPFRVRVVTGLKAGPYCGLH